MWCKGRVMAVETIAEETTDSSLSPMYRLLLHNDDHNNMDFVVRCLLEVIPHMTESRAMEIMLEAHQSGVALVITCDQNHAEFYCHLLRRRGLIASVEPA